MALLFSWGDGADLAVDRMNMLEFVCGVSAAVFQDWQLWVGNNHPKDIIFSTSSLWFHVGLFTITLCVGIKLLASGST